MNFDNKTQFEAHLAGFIACMKVHGKEFGLTVEYVITPISTIVETPVSTIVETPVSVDEKLMDFKSAITQSSWADDVESSSDGSATTINRSIRDDGKLEQSDELIDVSDKICFYSMRHYFEESFSSCKNYHSCNDIHEDDERFVVLCQEISKERCYYGGICHFIGKSCFKDHTKQKCKFGLDCYNKNKNHNNLPQH